MRSKIIITFIISSAFFSCTKKPEACIEASETNVILKPASISNKIKFTSCSKNAETYSWDFGDGQKGTGPTAEYYYDQIGEYEVKLTAYSKKEKKLDIASTIIKVTCPTPVASAATNITSTGFTANWSGNTSGAYYVDVSTNPDFTNIMGGCFTSYTSCAAGGIFSPNTTYYYRVYANCNPVNSGGNVTSEYSNTISVTTLP